MKEKNKVIPIIFLLLIFAMLVFLSSKDNSPLYHEGERIFNGYSYLKYGNSINQAGYPLLTHSLAAVPLLFMDINYPEDFDFTSPKVFGQRDFLYYGDNNAREMLFLARLPFIIIGVILGLFIFLWAEELFGYKAGLLSLTLFSFSPTMIGYTPIVAADINLAAFLFIASYFFWKFYTKPRPHWLILCGGAFGLAIATKPPAIVLLPIFFLIGIIGVWKKKNIELPRKRNAFLVLLSILFMIVWIGGIAFLTIHLNEIHPFFNLDDPLYKNSEARSEERIEKIIETLPLKSEWSRNVVEYVATKVPIPAPHFFEGLYSISRFVKEDNPPYFLREYRHGMKGLLYALIFLMKSPISFLILLALLLVLAIQNKGGWKFQSLFLIIPICIFPLQFIMGTTYGTVVYILPIFPFIFVLLGNLVNYKEMQKRRGKIILGTLITMYIITALIVFPYYLSFFNSASGGTEGYTFSLLDFDYYQDTYRLEEYVQTNHLEDIKVNLSYYSSSLAYQNFPYTPIAGNNPQTGLIAVNSFALIGVKEKDQNEFAWLRRLEPMTKVGTTIFIYNVTQKDLTRIEE